MNTFFERIRVNGTPVANAENIVTCGQARFTILTPRLIRLEWAVDQCFEDRATFAFPNRFAAAPNYSYSEKDHSVEITTEFLTLRYVEDGQPFSPTNLSIVFSFGSSTVTWVPGKVNLGNLRGTTRTLDQCADAANLEEGLLSREGWTLYDNSNSVVWDQEQTWLEARSDNHIQDWYFFGYGNDYKGLLNEYIQFGGNIPLIPRYVLGGWWSRFWAYHAEDLKQLVNDFQSHDVPLDVLVVDMDWHTPDGWTGYTWNKALFPDPEAFLRWVHDQQLYVTFNLHPAQGVQKHEAAYSDFAVQLGRDPSSGEGIEFKAADKAFIENYFKLLHHPMEEQGVDFWWVDWQQGDSTELKNLDPLPWLNHLHFRDSTRRGTRPMLYSRWGGLGNHRYPIGFSGDTYSTWESLAFQPYFTSTASNVGFGWWSHDIGGHFGAADPELYTRWVQFGAMSPCLRLHSTKDPLAERRPWGFTEAVYQASKKAFQFRYQLLPYLYSAARNNSAKGLSLCYPMYYEYPECEDAYLARGQYFLGDQLIAAPIVSPSDPITGLASVDVWIPEGNWIEFTTQETFTGPRWIRTEGNLERIPLFAKQGAVVPMAPKLMRTKAFDGSHIILNIFPGAEGYFELYEDDGNTQAYLDGEYEITPIHLAALNQGKLHISIDASIGSYDLLPRQRTFELHLKQTKRPNDILLNQTQLTDWSYDDKISEPIIFIREAVRGTTQQIEINCEIQPDNQLVSSPTPPWVHWVDYSLFDDAQKQLGTLIIVPPTDASTFTADVEWTLYKSGHVLIENVHIQDCYDEQIVNSPFKDEGDFRTFRWSAVVTISWQGQTITETYRSQTAYPSITNWQYHIYNPDEKPLTIAEIGTNNLDWVNASPTRKTSLNLKQPSGLVLLEHEQQRLLNKEPLAACVKTTIHRERAQNRVLLFQQVGEAHCYLNGVELKAIESIQHAPMQPMFYSWMPPKQVCYELPLEVGDNQLIVFTQPNTEINWWGMGGIIFDDAGQVVTD